MWKARNALALSSVFLLASCFEMSSSNAMTPEETVAFILFGMRDGVSVYEREQEIVVQKESDTPLLLNMTMANKKLGTIRVEKKDDCRYASVLEVEGPLGKVGGLYDLSELVSATVEGEDFDATVTFDKISLTCEAGCSDTDRRFQKTAELPSLMMMASDKDAVKADHKAAIESFRQNICRPQ